MSDEMKVRVNRAALADAAAWVSQAISKNPNAAVLAGMRLTAAGNTLTLAGFDYDTAHTAHVSAEVISDGEVLVSGRFLVQIVSAMKGADLDLVLDGQRLSIAAGGSTYRVGTMSLVDYPNLPELPAHVGKVEQARFAEAIGMAEHAVSRSSTVRALTAFNLRGTAGELTLAATDGFRVVRVVSAWGDASGAAFTANVPATALTASVKGLSGVLSLGCQGGLFSVSDGARSITTRMLGEEESFPLVDKLFAVEPPLTVEADGDLMAEAIKRTLLVTEEYDLIVVEFSEGAVSIHADSDTAEGDEVLEADGDAAMSLRFNGSYLMQALNASPGERVRLGLFGPGKQVLIQPVGVESVAFIVMPRRAK